MALKPQAPPRQTEEGDRIARLAAEVAIDPPFVERLAKADAHGDYLEHAHESTLRTLAVIDMRMSREDWASAHELLQKLRRHLDSLWEQRKEAAERAVAP